jgi:hypothetical protein
MKTSFMTGNQFLFLGLSLLLFVGCEKTGNEKPVPSQFSNFPLPIFSIVSPGQVDQFREAGMLIYDGVRPPELYNVVFFNDDVTPPDTIKVSFPIRHTCIYDNRTPSNVNTVFANYTDSLSIIFREQDNSYITDLRYISPLDNGVGTGYAMGLNNNFTAFFEISNGELDGVSYEALWVISGTVTRDPNNQITGIGNKQDCFMMLEKSNDPLNKVADVGTIRVFRDEPTNTDAPLGSRPSLSGRSLMAR